MADAAIENVDSKKDVQAGGDSSKNSSAAAMFNDAYSTVSRFVEENPITTGALTAVAAAGLFVLSRGKLGSSIKGEELATGKVAEPGLANSGVRLGKSDKFERMLSRPMVFDEPTGQVGKFSGNLAEQFADSAMKPGQVLSKVLNLRDLMKHELPHSDLLKSATHDLSTLVHKKTGVRPDLTGAQSQKFIVDWVKEGVGTPQARKSFEDLMNPLIKPAENPQFLLENALARAKTPFYKMPENATLPTPANMNLPKWFPY